MEVASRQAGILHERIHLYLNGAMLMFVRSGFVGCLTGLSVCLFLLRREERMKERKRNDGE